MPAAPAFAGFRHRRQVRHRRRTLPSGPLPNGLGDAVAEDVVGVIGKGLEIPLLIMPLLSPRTVIGSLALS